MGPAWVQYGSSIGVQFNSAAVMVSDGSVGFNSTNAARNRGNKHHLAFGFASEQTDLLIPSGRFLSPWERTEVRVRLRYTPAQFSRQPHGGLPDKLVFGVGVGHCSRD